MKWKMTCRNPEGFNELQSLKEFENLQDQQLDHITKEFEAAKLACHSLESEREQLLGVFNENQKLRVPLIRKV
jgi:hypothetical protein